MPDFAHFDGMAGFGCEEAVPVFARECWSGGGGGSQSHGPPLEEGGKDAGHLRHR